MGAWAEDNHRTRVDPLWRPVNKTLTHTAVAEQNERTNEETSLEGEDREELGEGGEGDSLHIVPGESR